MKITVDFFHRMEQYKDLINRKTECVPFNSIWSLPMERSVPFHFRQRILSRSMGIVWKSKWYSDFPIIPLKTRKEEYLSSYPKFSKTISVEMPVPFNFPTDNGEPSRSTHCIKSYINKPRTRAILCFLPDFKSGISSRFTQLWQRKRVRQKVSRTINFFV